MLIRNEQIESMYLARLDESVRSFAADFRATIPDTINQYDDEALCANIRRGIDRARTYGIVGGSALEQFLALSLLISPDFDQEPATHPYLHTPGIDEDRKLDLLTGLSSERLREDAGRWQNTASSFRNGTTLLAGSSNGRKVARRYTQHDH